MEYIVALIAQGFLVGMVCFLLGVRHGRKLEVASSASRNSRRNAISKKESYAAAMYRLEDEQDALDARDVGEAYNFHMDCGDR